MTRYPPPPAPDIFIPFTLSICLVGNTNRPETLEVMNSIGYDDYAIRVVGNKIVITAHVADRLYEAVEYFCANALKGETVEGKAIVSCEANYQFKGDRKYFIDHDNPLEGYRIVSSSSSKSSAEPPPRKIAIASTSLRSLK